MGINIVEQYCDDLTKKEYIVNPAIAREEEIKKLVMILLTPDKSGLLIGKAGIGKTAIVEGLAYMIQKDTVPNVLKGFRILKVNSTSLTGKTVVNGSEILTVQLFVEGLKKLENTILFIDEIHTLIGAKGSGPMDLANILKPALDRGDIKVIGATTNGEYEEYIIKDRAFLRRFDRVDVLEPSEEVTAEILFKSLPRLEKKTGCKFAYSDFLSSELIKAIVSATSEFKRVYGLSAQYPDIAFSVLSSAFSQALFNNRNLVNLLDVYNAIKTSKRIYSDSIIKELNAFREKFDKYCIEYNIELPVVKIEEIRIREDSF